MPMTDMSLVARSLRAHRLSTIVTSLMVAIGVALLMTLLTVRDSASRAFLRGTGNMHLLVSAQESRLESVLNSVFHSGIPQRVVTWEQFRSVASLPPVEWALATVQGDNYRGYATMGVQPAFFEKFLPDGATPMSVSAGTFFREGDAGVFDVVLGSLAASGAGLNVGDTLTITHGADEKGQHHEEFKFTIAGVLAPTGTAHDRVVFVTAESKWIVHADEFRQQAARAAGAAWHEEPTPANLTPAEKPVTAIYVKMKATPTIAQVATLVRNELGLTAAYPASEVRRLLGIVGNADVVLIGIALIVMVSGALGVMLALYNSMEHRRRQLAVLRVLGASKERLLSLVLSESAAIGLLGALLGLVIAIVGTQVTAVFLSGALGVPISGAIDPLWAIIVVSGTVLLSAVAGLVPAVRAYRTPVIRNLRPIG
jgi:putative ABC transport system permease protein